MKRVKISTSTGLRNHSVRAHVFGPWAAHVGYEGDGWTVTDVRSGLAAVKWLDERDAIRVAQRLSSSVQAPPVVGSLEEIRSGTATYPAGVDKFEFRYIVEALIGEELNP